MGKPRVVIGPDGWVRYSHPIPFDVDAKVQVRWGLIGFTSTGSKVADVNRTGPWSFTHYRIVG